MESQVDLNRVTIVIPLHSGIEDSKACIESVLAHGDLEFNKCVIVNDCGPDVEDMEDMVLGLVSGHASVTYHRNRRNLGFVETCNRAIFNLDNSDNDVLLLNSDAALTAGALREMLEVLYADEKHGVVHPRSNEATIASVPVLPLQNREVTIAESQGLFLKLRDHLPRWTVTPVAVGFCFLFKRSLAQNYGLFDVVYSPGYSEENDFCWRVNRLGYSAILANHAFVSHLGSRSFSDDVKRKVVEKNNRVLTARYPHHTPAVMHYLQYLIEPADWFSDRIFNPGAKRVLVDLFHMSLVYNGSTRNALSFLDVLAARSSEFSDVEFTIVTSAEAADFFGLARYGFPICFNGELEETFDLGFALSPISAETQINVLNRHALRWVVCHFDIIALRVISLLEFNFARRQVVLDSLNWADRIVAISQSAVDDLESYFGNQLQGLSSRTTVLLEGVAAGTLPETDHFASLGAEIDDVLERDNYVLVIGNQFPHKHFPETLKTLAAANLGMDILAFGSQNEEQLVSGVTNLAAGHLSDSQVAWLYQHANCVVFPSTYEGFGLPTVEVASIGNTVILFDTKVSHEVADSLGISQNVRYFSLLRELPSIVREYSKKQSLRPLSVRKLDDYNSELLDLVLEELNRPVNVQRLAQRVWAFRKTEIYTASVEQRLAEVSRSYLSLLNSPPGFIWRVLRKALKPARDKLRRRFRPNGQISM